MTLRDLDLVLLSLTLITALLGYIIRLERKISVISADIEWLKKVITPCLPLSKNHN